MDKLDDFRRIAQTDVKNISEIKNWEIVTNGFYKYRSNVFPHLCYEILIIDGTQDEPIGDLYATVPYQGKITRHTLAYNKSLSNLLLIATADYSTECS